jgi:hypothetical protein
MIFRRPTLPGIAKAVIVAGVGLTMLTAQISCGGDPKFRPPAIVVTFDPFFPPPTSINAGAFWEQGLAADVANDTKNSGVIFSCAPAGDCGSFSPTGAASTDPTCYQAPGTAPADGTVTLTATSVTDPTKSVTSAPITITMGPPGQSCAQ